MVRNKLRNPRTRLLVSALEDRTVPALFTVQNLADSGANSLRDCIAKANSAAGLDTINFAAGLSGTIKLTSGELAINGALNIVGPGANQITVSGNNASRIFNTAGSNAGTAISVSGLTISGGNHDQGGAIFVFGESLTLTDCVITGNNGLNHGGAIFLNGNSGTSSKLTLANCELTGNSAFNGGAVFGYFNVDLAIINSTLSANSAISGGAILLFSATPAADVTIRNSTISGNTADKTGGGIGSYLTTGKMVIQNSTIVGNSVASATGSGGGIYSKSPLAIESSIISGNNAATGPDMRNLGTTTLNFSATGSSSGFIYSGSNNLLAYPMRPFCWGRLPTMAGCKKRICPPPVALSSTKAQIPLG